MDDATYRMWWQLHIRVARGETLASEERRSYEAGLRQQQESERLDGGIGELRRVRAAVHAAETERDRMRQLQAELDREIAALESALGEHTRQLLEAGD